MTDANVIPSHGKSTLLSNLCMKKTGLVEVTGGKVMLLERTVVVKSGLVKVEFYESVTPEISTEKIDPVDTKTV